MMKVARMPLSKGATHQTPTRIVVHAMGEYIKGNDQDYHARDLLEAYGLSAHALVTPSGIVILCRAEDTGAYHAMGNNTNTLGVEFLVPGFHDYGSFIKAIQAPYLTDEQYEAGIMLMKHWMSEFDINRIDRHSDIDPDRKKDPGVGFPWEQFVMDISV